MRQIQRNRQRAACKLLASDVRALFKTKSGGLVSLDLGRYGLDGTPRIIAELQTMLPGIAVTVVDGYVKCEKEPSHV